MDFIPLGEILTESKEESLNPNPDNRIRVRLNVEGVEKRPLMKDKKGATKYYSRKAGQFIYGKQNLFKGAFGIVPEELDGFESSSDLPAFNVATICDPKWLFYYLKQNSHYKDLVKYATGTGSRRIQPKKLFEEKIPLPSLEQQQILIRKIESHELDFSIIFKNINHDFVNIIKLRQAILQEAIQGKIVSQNPNDELASILLNKIKKEKEELIKEKKIRKEKPLLEINYDGLPFEIPKNWMWVRLGEITTIKGGKRIPKGSQLSRTPTDHIYIRVSDMKNGTIDDSDLHYISDEIYQKIKSYLIKKEDIYLTIVGATIGKLGIVPEKFDNMNLTENAARIILYKTNQLYMKHVLNSNFIQNQFVNKTKQVGVQKMALQRVKSTIFPLPPLEEQKRIVAKVEELMKLCDELEEKTKENQKKSELLMDAILREAFHYEA